MEKIELKKRVENIEMIKPPKEFFDIAKLILEQNRIILMTNKMLLETLAYPSMIVK